MKLNSGYSYISTGLNSNIPLKKIIEISDDDPEKN